jgi:hypothetical protein
VAEAPTKPISGAVSHCATQYVVDRAEHVNAVARSREAVLLVLMRLKVVVVGRQAFVLRFGSGETLTSSVSGHVVLLDFTGQRASCTDRVTGRKRKVPPNRSSVRHIQVYLRE